MMKIEIWLKDLGEFIKNNPAKSLTLVTIGFGLGALHNWLGF